MKTDTFFKAICVLISGSLILTSCSSTTLIQSNPTGVKLFVNGELAGTTPYSYQDRKITGTCTPLKLEAEGYRTYDTTLCRNEETDVRAIVGGIFLLVPFLWTKKYHPTHTYELTFGSETEDSPKKPGSKSKAERLQEMKQLYDDGIISRTEYEKEKKKILEDR